MRQFTLTQLLMAVWLVAIALTFVRSEGCGRRYTKVSCVAFSRDGKHLAVVRHDARDARTPLKCYKANVCRTISVLDVATGSTEEIVEQDLQRGNQGPAFDLWWPGRKSISFGPTSDTLLVQHFGGGEVRLYDRRSGTWRRPFAGGNPQSLNMAVSPDGTILATGRWDGATLWDVTSGRKLHDMTTQDNPFLGAPRLAISADNKVLATAGYSGVRLWNVTDGSRGDTVPEPSGSRVPEALAFSPVGQTIAVAYEGGLHVYDLEESQDAEFLSGKWVSAIAFSRDGKTVAAVNDDGVTLINVATGETLEDIPCKDYVTSLAYSPDGGLIAVGDRVGKLTYFNAATREHVRTVTVPGRTRHAWTLSVAALAIWGLVCYWLWRWRRKADGLPDAVGRVGSHAPQGAVEE